MMLLEDHAKQALSGLDEILEDVPKDRREHEDIKYKVKILEELICLVKRLRCENEKKNENE